MLKRPEYADYWALKWSDLLRVNRLALGRKNAYRYYQWIHDSFARNAPMDDFAHRKLDDLAGFRARNVRHLNDTRRHMTRRAFGEDERPDSGRQIVVKREPFLEPHEQHHPGVAVPFLADGEPFLDFRHLFAEVPAHMIGLGHGVGVHLAGAAFKAVDGKIEMVGQIVEVLLHAVGQAVGPTR